MKKLSNKNIPEKSDNFDKDEKLLEVDDIITDLKSMMEEKEAMKEYKQLTEQGAENNTLYIIPTGSKFKLIKGGKETEITVSEDSIIGESTFLSYLEGKKIYANATIKVLGNYLEVTFEKLKSELEKNSSIELVKSFFKELENKRNGKTEIVER